MILLSFGWCLLIGGLDFMPQDRSTNLLRGSERETTTDLSVAARKGQIIMRPSPKVRAVAAALSQANRKVQVFKKA